MSIAQIDTLPDSRKELLDDARRTGESVRIVEDGTVVARIVPEPSLDSAQSHHDPQSTDIDHLRTDLSKTWPSGISAVDAIREDRGRLDEDPSSRRARIHAARDRLKQISTELNIDPIALGPRHSESTDADETGAILDRLWSLGDNISFRWPKDVSAVGAIRDVRRDL